MNCCKQGCKYHFHVTCAQAMGLLFVQHGNSTDEVKYVGYCQNHYTKQTEMVGRICILLLFKK